MRVPSSDRTSFLYTPATGSAYTISSAPSAAAKQSPTLATSTPSSLSFVDVSAPVKAAVRPARRSATTSAWR